jgi:hypothetical protein
MLTMTNLRSTIEALASQFASNLLGALRGASIDEIYSVAARGGAAAPARRGRPPRAAGAAATPAPVARRGKNGRLGRRSQGDIAKMVESIVDLLQKNGSGLRAEQIRSALGCDAKELPRPLADALSSGRVTKTGQKRATTYFASGSGGAKRRAGRGRKKKG